ncbi:MAG: hypothetical protein U1E65_21605 [Myxococcota bacterium]
MSGSISSTTFGPSAAPLAPSSAAKKKRFDPALQEGVDYSSQARPTLGPGGAVKLILQDAPEGLEEVPDYNGTVFCGETVLEMAVRAGGGHLELTPAEGIKALADDATYIPNKGTKYDDLVRAAKNVGLDPQAKIGALDFDWIRKQLLAKRVVMIRGNVCAVPPYAFLPGAEESMRGHYMLITGFSKGSTLFRVLDPAGQAAPWLSERVLDTFVRTHVYALNGEPFGPDRPYAWSLKATGGA